MGYFIGANGAYHEGDELDGDTAVPQRPSPVYDWVNGAWSVNLGRAQAQVKAAIDDKVAALFVAGIVPAGTAYQGKTLQLDPTSQSSITAAGAAAKFALITNPATTWSQVWIMADNSRLTLTAQQVSDMADQAMAKVSDWVLNARGHKDAVLALTDGAAVLAYDFSGGW